MSCRYLLLFLSVYFIKEIEAVCDQKNVTLQVSKFETQLQGNFSVPCDEHPRQQVLCAEVFSRRLMQNVICSALGLQYTDDKNLNMKLVECYSMRYPEMMQKGKPARIICNITTDADNQWIRNGQDVNISFHSLDYMEQHAQWHLKLSTLTIFSNDTNDTDNFVDVLELHKCIDVILNISAEERDQLAPLIKNDTNINCSATNTVNLTVSSLTYVTMTDMTANNDEMRTTPANKMVVPTQCAKYPNLVEQIAVGLVCILLISLIIVLCTVLIYTQYCHKKIRYRRITRANNRAMSLSNNSYSESTLPLARASYVQIEESADITKGREDKVSRNRTLQVTAAGIGNGVREGAMGTGLEEAHYDELENCRLGGHVCASYSRLNYTS